MTLQQIQTAVVEGKTVNWKNSAYVVINDGNRYLILCLLNNSCTGLTWTDGITMNEKESDFFITL